MCLVGKTIPVYRGGGGGDMNFFLTFRLCMIVFGGQWLVQEYFDIKNQNALFPMQLLHDLF